MPVPTSMQVIECREAGGPDVLQIAERPVPTPKAGELLIRVHAAGVNRADLLQRRGKYPAPDGASDILGLEVSGEIASLGEDVSEWRVGDKVCALLEGGGYSEYVTVASTQCLPIPDGMNMVEAAALPEAIFTVYLHLFTGATQVRAGEIVLIHGGSSGIGTTAVQMLKQFGVRVAVTVGSDEKAAFCRTLGADIVVNYKTHDFVDAVRSANDGRGVDVVWDMVGGDYVPRNLSLLAQGGRQISLATQQSASTNIDLRMVMQKKLVLTGMTLRSRSREEKATLTREIAQKIWPLVTKKLVKPLIYQIYPLNNAAEAHKVMEKGGHMGKIVLEVAESPHP